MKWGMISAGLALMVWGFAFDASVPTDDGIGAVMNLGLIATKQLIFSLGAVAFLAGIVLVAADRISAAVSSAIGTLKAQPDKVTAEKAGDGAAA